MCPSRVHSAQGHAPSSFAHPVPTVALARSLPPQGTGGWGAPFLTRMCCGTKVDATLEPCPPDSCPLHATGTPLDLPGAPFLAEITAAGKCRCLEPTRCDA